MQKVELKHKTVLTKSATNYCFTLDSGVFLMLYNKNPFNDSFGIFFNKIEDSSEIKNILKPLFLSKFSDYNVKVIGDKVLTEFFKDSFKSLGFVVENNKEFELPAEVMFLQSESKLRVASAAKSKTNSNKTKVLIIDDSKTIRSLLTKIISSDQSLEVVDAIEFPHQVEKVILEKKPDVITLDIHLPEMDGVTLLKTVISKYKIPTIMISSLSMQEGNTVLSALENGAVDYIQKPSFEDLPVMAPMIIEKIKTAASASLQHTNKFEKSYGSRRIYNGKLSQNTLIAIGSSTGGTEALREILTRLPAEIPPVVIVQHIPAVFSKAFAERMNQLCAFKVVEGADGEEVLPGKVIVAPGGKQMGLVQKGKKLFLKIDENAMPVNRHKPSVDYMFDSLLGFKDVPIIALILTGMGADGAKGMLRLKQKGARTIAQDEKSCVVFGMPREAIQLGGAEKTVSLLDIPSELIEILSKPVKKSVA